MNISYLYLNLILSLSTPRYLSDKDALKIQ
jgi:hypothetical protein